MMLYIDSFVPSVRENLRTVRIALLVVAQQLARRGVPSSITMQVVKQEAIAFVRPGGNDTVVFLVLE